MVEQDRRVRRTRKTLHDALISLILENGYEGITVQDILDRADVGRSTFYTHYRDKEALLMTSFDDLRAQLQGEMEAASACGVPSGSMSPVQAATAVFEHAHRNHRIYRALCGRQGGSIVHAHLHRLVGGVLHDHLRDRIAKIGLDMPVDVVAEFYTSSVLGLLSWWIRADFPYGPARLAEIYRKLACSNPFAGLN